MKEFPKISISSLVISMSYLQFIWPILFFFSSFVFNISTRIIIIINKKAPITPPIIKYFFHLGIGLFSSVSEKKSTLISSIYKLK